LDAKSVGEYLVPFSNGSGNYRGYLKKNYLSNSDNQETNEKCKQEFVESDQADNQSTVQLRPKKVSNFIGKLY
jgi:hypothetical protein